MNKVPNAILMYIFVFFFGTILSLTHLLLCLTLGPTYTSNLTELTTRFFHGDSSNFTTSFTRRNSRAFVSVASVRMSRHVFIRKML